MRKITSLVLAVVLSIGMATIAWADSSARTDAIEKQTVSLATYAKLDGKAIQAEGDYIELDKINPTDKQAVDLYLYEDMFDWKDGGTLEHKLLTSKQIRDNKITVRSSVSSGSKAIDSIALEEKESRVRVKFTQKYVSTKDLDFSVKVYLTIDGKRQDSTSATLSGTLVNELYEVFREDDYVDLSGGLTVHARDYVPQIEVNLGNGVSVHTKMFKDKKYYGVASMDMDSSDEKVFSKYPDMEQVITLDTIGLDGDVVIDTGGINYYVYDADLKYLGRSNEKLPFTEKYYLSAKKLEINQDEIDEPDVSDDDADEDEAPIPVDPSEPGADNENANPGTGDGATNPDTGSTSYVAFAAIAGVVALGAAIFTRKK